MKYIRSDFVFSYWIFAWFILYYIGLIKTPPILLLYIGLFGNLIELLYLIYNKSPRYSIIKFTIINTFLKVIPLYIIWNKSITNHEIKITLIVTIFYFIWLHINNVSAKIFYSGFLNTYKSGRGKKTIISAYYDELYKMITPTKKKNESKTQL